MDKFPNSATSRSEVLNHYWGLVDEVVNRFGSKEFVITKDGSITFARADALAKQITAAVRKAHSQPKAGVGIFLRDPREVIPCMMGAIRANDYFVVLDVFFPQKTLQAMIRDAEISVILTNNMYYHALEAVAGSAVVLLNIDALEAPAELAPAAVTYSLEDVVQIMFTSGSTGNPKGVIEPYGYLLRGAFIKLDTYQYTTTDKILRLSSFTFAGPHVDVFAALIVGLSLCYYDVKVDGFGQLPEFIRQQKPTIYTSTSTTFRSFISVLQQDDKFPSLRTMVLAGEKRLQSDIVAVKRHFPRLRQIRLGFAGTETGFVASTMVSPETALKYETLPSGQPHDDVVVHIWDENSKDLPVGQEGEMVVEGDFLARGYINEPELTKRKFIPVGGSSVRQLYRTGDLGKILPDGQIMHLGRLDSMIKIRGIRIELESIENLVVGFPGVVHVASKVITDGHGARRLATYYTSEDGVALPVAELRRHLAEHLPVQQLPSYLVWVEKMPMTDSGKVALEKLPLPVTARPELGYPFAAPASEAEKKLAAIWEEYIGIKGIGVNDDFFDLGGDSLIGVIIFSAIEEAFGANLPVSTLLKAPTIQKLAQVLTGALPQDLQAQLIPIHPSGSKPPLFFIPGKGGYPLRVRHLAKKLDGEIPIFAFQNVISEKMVDLPGSVEGTASQYLSEIRKTYPAGPYVFVGESLGGKIAYEMAQQLAKAGSPKPLLFMLDTYNDERILLESRKIRRRFAYYRMLAAKHTSIWLNSDWEGKKEYLRFYRETFFKKTFSHLRNRLQRSQKKATQTQPALPDSYARAEERNVRAAQAYFSKPYPGQVVLITALRGPEAKIPANGWGSVGIGDLVVEELDCYHGSMLFEPAVSKLAIIIQSHINDPAKESPV